MNVSGEYVVFILLAILMVGGAVMMVSSAKVVHMVVSLAVTFVGLAGVYVLLEAEFLAFVQLLVYGGGISILMIFGIMMTQHEQEEQLPGRSVHDALLLVGVLGLFFMLFIAIREAVFPEPEAVDLVDSTVEIGKALFTSHVIPFELVSVLLTVAFIGAIVLARKEDGGQ